MQYYLKYREKYDKYREKYDKLMAGRHGFDTLCRDLLVIWIVIGFLNGFIRSRIVSIASLLLPLFSLLRAFSTNTVKRSAESRKYKKMRDDVFEFFKISYRKIKERKTHKYYKCKNCSSYLRVKRKPGEHTVVCPKCGKEIRVKIR